MRYGQVIEMSRLQDHQDRLALYGRHLNSSDQDRLDQLEKKHFQMLRNQAKTRNYYGGTFV